jgi:cytidylate kinase
MPLVTLSAAYGANGTEIGPRLAERLGVPFLDRAIPSAVAERLAVPLTEADTHDDAVGSLLSRMVMRLAPMGQAFGAAATTPYDGVDADVYRQATEAIVRERAEAGEGVILGRSGALILHDDPRALHVRLDGPRELRVAAAMRIEGVDRDTAERRLADTDHARNAYARHFYRADARDPCHYQLVLDSTALPVGTCVELIALAAIARTR